MFFTINLTPTSIILQSQLTDYLTLPSIKVQGQATDYTIFKFNPEYPFCSPEPSGYSIHFIQNFKIDCTAFSTIALITCESALTSKQF